MRHVTKLIITIAFPLGLVAYPLSILLPVERHEIENVPVDTPEVRLEDLTSYSTYREILSYVRSANPLRALLIRAAAGIDFWTFDESPDPTRVLKGKDGWLYYRPTMERPCSTSPAVVAENTREFVERLEEDIPNVVITIAPSKFVIHPENLTADQSRLSTCARNAGAQLRALISQGYLSHYVDSWELFESLKSDGLQPYFRTDTHFNFEASISWMEALIEEIDEIWDPEAVQYLGRVMWLGNLMSFISLDEPEEVEKWIVQRGVSAQKTEIRTRISHYMHSGDRPFIPGRAVVLGDSFLELPEESLVQYFADITVIDWRADGGFDYFLDQLADSSTVVIEVSELDIWDHFADSSLLDAYEARTTG